MSFFDIFKKKDNGGCVARNRRCYIIDAATLDSNKGERIRLTPRNQMDILRRLSRFVKKEKLEMCVVFEGKPLRDAPDNKVYNDDVLVRYASGTNEVINLVNAIDAENRSKTVLVITADKNMESVVMKRRGALMHSSTFRKALETNGNGKSERSSGNRRRQNRKSSGTSKNTRAQDGQNQNKPPKAKTVKKEEDAVSELIDLV